MIELNADVGEGYDDASLMSYLARVSIACGGHAGDGLSMAAALQLAADHGVTVGAHPSYPDPAHFGRRVMAATAAEITAWVTRQIETLAEQSARLGLRLMHVKPHGALYSVAARDPEVAAAIARAVADFDARLALVGRAGSVLISEGIRAGLPVLNEAFADRRYRSTGDLVSRETAGALITDPEDAASQALKIARGEPFTAHDGGMLRLRADTICLHSDTSNALIIAQAIHAALNTR